MFLRVLVFFSLIAVSSVCVLAQRLESVNAVKYFDENKCSVPLHLLRTGFHGKVNL